MTKYKIFMSIFLSIIFISGCSQAPSPGGGKAEETVISINNYNITRGEFEKEFKDSAYGKNGTPEDRKAFLENLINRKLILQQAQKEGLDKEKSFLKAVEKFWEQSLLKIALDKKTKEIDAKISVSGWDAKRKEEDRMMDEWINELRSKANIKIKSLPDGRQGDAI